MIEVLKIKPTLFRGKKYTAELCKQVMWFVRLSRDDKCIIKPIISSTLEPAEKVYKKIRGGK